MLIIFGCLDFLDNSNGRNHEGESEEDEEYTEATYNEQNFEEIWNDPSTSYNSQMQIEDDPMEGCSGLNVNASCGD